MRPIVCLFIYLFTYLFIYLFIHSFIYLFILFYVGPKVSPPIVKKEKFNQVAGNKSRSAMIAEIWGSCAVSG